MIQAVIMAAGKSTRTYPLTLTKPKPLLRIANKTILAHQLDQFVGLIQEVIIIVGYKSKMIQEHFGYSYRSIALGYVEQQEQLGTGHAAMQARPYIRDRFLLMNGDDLYAREDIEACLRYPYGVLGKEVADPRKFGVLTVENGLVRDLIEKPEHPASNLTNVGMYALDKKIFGILDTIPKSPRGEYEVTDAIKRLAQIVDVHCHVMKGHWIPVGYPWHILNANDFLLGQYFEEIASDKITSGPPSKKGRIRGIIEEGVKIEGNIFLEEHSIIRQGSYIQGNVWIGKNCVIGPNCHITGNTSIGDNSHIGHGAAVKNSVIDRQCQIEPFCNILHSVLGENVSIGTGTVTMSAPIETKTVTSVIKEQVVASDREQFGVTVGSHVTIQPHVVTYPGVKIAPDTVVPPGTVVKEDLMRFKTTT
jgi:bifunctional UDP-N-acetylglucosamine pyrophosphorylase/glucosamine-1-phosphate N-acetyltransferase